MKKLGTIVRLGWVPIHKKTGTVEWGWWQVERPSANDIAMLHSDWSWQRLSISKRAERSYYKGETNG